MHEVVNTEHVAIPIRQRIERGAPGLLERWPIDTYLAALDTLDAYTFYGALPQRIIDWCIQTRDQHGADVLGDYHRLLLLRLVDGFEGTAAPSAYPASILGLFRGYLRGVVAQMPRNPSAFYLPANDLFIKDLAVCRQTLIPCGAQLVERHSAVPRSWGWRDGTRHLLAFSSYVAFRLHGFRPLYQLHMDSRLVLEFNPPGWARCYRRIAELLDRDSAVRGVFGASWWFDPQLERVSPRLSFLRTLPTSNGARVFRLGERESTTRLALTDSKQRQDLYNQGRYRPADYLLVWGRKDLLAWASKTT